MEAAQVVVMGVVVAPVVGAVAVAGQVMQVVDGVVTGAGGQLIDTCCGRRRGGLACCLAGGLDCVASGQCVRLQGRLSVGAGHMLLLLLSLTLLVLLVHQLVFSLHLELLLVVLLLGSLVGAQHGRLAGVCGLLGG